LPGFQYACDKADNDGVDDHNRGGLQGCKHSGIDASQDDHRRQNAPDGALHGAKPFRPAGLGHLLVLAAAGACKNGISREDQRHDYAGKNTCHEQRPGGLVGDATVYDHRAAGRDEDAQSTASRHHAVSQARVITTLDHGRQGKETDGHGSGRTGSRNCGKNSAGRHGSHRQTPGEVAHPFTAQIIQMFPHPPRLKQMAPQYKNRQGQQHVVI